MSRNLTSSAPNLILITGPARSGKSEWAEALATQSGKSVIYVATAQSDPSDLEWQQRIEQHRRRRPPDWKTMHVPIELPTTLLQSTASTCLLIDSLGTWLANLIEYSEADWNRAKQNFLDSLNQCQSDVILVAEEVGWGLVPAYPVGRVFRDRLGTLVRQVGAISQSTYLVTGGYALNLNNLGTPVPAPVDTNAE
jgi:adenosylcobinamide kinase / adenosylcobinamide-phosphate guanylyltransferase